jgi:16S rRNA (adenine1518-N6/adenine1519-N6)-dimethyltransferase
VIFKPLAVSSLMHDYGIEPRKGLGQNFLINETYLAKITEAAHIDKNMDVLEIGAGMGNLTRHLAAAARHVTAVELDRQLIPILKKVTRDFANVQSVQGDILELPVNDLMDDPGYVVAANIPYYITSALIRYLLECTAKPSAIVLTIQREVAQRICADAGELSLLALSVQVYGSPMIAFRIPSGAFYPVPKVDSAVLTVDLYDQPMIPYKLLESFFRLAKAAFTQKRKMLHNALAGAPDLNKEKADLLLSRAGIDPKRRAQMLTIEEWKRLTRVYEDMLTN